MQINKFFMQIWTCPSEKNEKISTFIILTTMAWMIWLQLITLYTITHKIYVPNIAEWDIAMESDLIWEFSN